MRHLGRGTAGHAEVQGTEPRREPQGAHQGEASVLGDATYHFASGYDGYARNTPDKLTQDFLATLPEKWRKQKIELSTSGINEDAPSDKELAKRGLAPKVRNVWSLVEDGD